MSLTLPINVIFYRTRQSCNTGQSVGQESTERSAVNHTTLFIREHSGLDAIEKHDWFLVDIYSTDITVQYSH